MAYFLQSFLTIFILFLVHKESYGYKSCYNHQEETYNAKFDLKTCNPNDCTITPFLSPDNSLEAHLQLIEEAQESITIANPNFDSWVRECKLHGTCHDEGRCAGCELSYYQNNETFPLFPALLNALHLRKLKVRILTNNYSIPTCQEKATILDWLSINQATIRMYKTTTFLHAKFMMIDNGRKVLISSVNFSFSSFMKNRETGVIISECNQNCDVVQQYKSAFELDWNLANSYVLDNQYSDNQMKIITDTSRYANLITTPPSERLPGLPVMSLKSYSNVKISGYVSPDHARDIFFETINKTQKSLNVHIYEVTDLEICQQLINLKNNGVNVTMIVSFHVSYPPERNHKKCYQDLINNGVSVKNSWKEFPFSHQKYWIIDEKTVHLSTGNWAGSDFPKGNEWEPSSSDRNINRNMLIIMENQLLVENFFKKLFQHDYSIGEPIVPQDNN